MLLAASIYTTNTEKLRTRWKLESGFPAVPGQKVHTPAVTGPATTTSPLTCSIMPPGLRAANAIRRLDAVDPMQASRRRWRA